MGKAKRGGDTASAGLATGTDEPAKMEKQMPITCDEVLEHFTNYIFDNRANAAAVRSITPWLGFLVKGLEKMHVTWDRRTGTTRQVRFTIPGRPMLYVASYQHRVHGVTFTEGSALGAVVRTFCNVHDAAAFYDNPTVP